MARPIKDILNEKDISLAFSQYVDYLIDREAKLGYDALIQIEKNITHATIFEFEVINGGYEQFFGNCSGDYVPETIEALKDIGAKKLPAYLNVLCTKMDNLGLKDRDERSIYLMELPEEESQIIYNDFDHLMDEESIYDFSIEYFKKNIETLRGVYFKD